MPKRLYINDLANIATYILLAFTTLLAIAAIKKERLRLMRHIGLFKY